MRGHKGADGRVTEGTDGRGDRREQTGEGTEGSKLETDRGSRREKGQKGADGRGDRREQTGE